MIRYHQRRPFWTVPAQRPQPSSPRNTCRDYEWWRGRCKPATWRLCYHTHRPHTVRLCCHTHRPHTVRYSMQQMNTAES